MALAHNNDRNTSKVEDLKRTDTKVNEPSVVVEFIGAEEEFSGRANRWMAIR